MCRLNGHLQFRVEEVSQSYEALSNRQKKLYITMADVSKKIKQKLARIYRSITRFDPFVKQKTLHNYG